MTKRDEFSVLLYEEDQKGPVYLDCRKVPEEAWEDLRRTLFKKIRFDFQKKSMAISPAVHFFMGGVRTDSGVRRLSPGLFACGEIVWGLHGANRRGGNALTECAVMGQITGRNATPLRPGQSLIEVLFGKKNLTNGPREKSHPLSGSETFAKR